jgi:hypothetical protein
MEYCGPRGIPHSQFLDWRDSDRSKAIWWSVRQRAACPSCGTRAEEWDPAKGGSRDAYRAELVECPGCVERERAQDAPELKRQRGLSVSLVRNRGV